MIREVPPTHLFTSGGKQVSELSNAPCHLLLSGKENLPQNHPRNIPFHLIDQSCSHVHSWIRNWVHLPRDRKK